MGANGRRFFARPESFRAAAGGRAVYLSPLLKWYGTDFGATQVEQLRALRPLLLPAGAALLDNPRVRVQYLDYDWSLNDQQLPPR